MQRTGRAAVAAWCIAAVMTLAGSAALAGEEDAKTMFASGRELRAAGKCEAAILQFRRALEVYPEGLGSLRNIAECEEQIGKFAAARRDWWDLRRAVLQTNEPKYKNWDKDAEQAHARLATKVARVTIKLEGVQLDRVRVSMDGKPLDPRLVGVELERDLGGHTIEALYGGASPLTERIELVEGERELVTLTIPAPTKEAPRPPPLPPVEQGTGSPAMRTAGVVALGIGGAALVGTVVAVVLREGALAEVEDKCPGYDSGECSSPTPGAVQDARSRGKTASLLVNVFGGVGLAGLGAGMALLIAGSGGRSQPAGAPQTTGAAKTNAWIGVSPTPNGAGAMARARVRF